MNALTFANLLLRHIQFQKHRSWTRARLEKHQQKSLKHLRTHAYEYSRFYPRFHKGLLERPLAELPVLTKELVMENFDELVTAPGLKLQEIEEYIKTDGAAGLYQGQYVINTTSGSSGHQGIFLFNRREWFTVVSSYMRMEIAKSASKQLPRHVKWVYILSMGTHQTHRLVRNFPCDVLSIADPLPEIVDRLNQLQPHAIGTYPSVAVILAEEQLKGKLKIAPHILRLGGEPTTADCRRKVKQAWGDVIYDIYGTTETGALAAQCDKSNGWHFWEDLSIVEVVDEKGKPVPPGVSGDKILATVLSRYTQPLIRYEINDKIRLADSRCPCQRPFQLIEAIDGRAEETLYFQDRAGNSVPVYWITLDKIMEPLPVARWQIAQKPDRLDVLLAGSAPDLDLSRIEQDLRKVLAAHGAIVPSIHVMCVSQIPRGATGKAPFFVRECASSCQAS
jgi:phenylacetate-CoA ligase